MANQETGGGGAGKEQWASRIGVILAVAGLAVGLGGSYSNAFAQEGAEPEQAEIAIEGVTEATATKGWDKKIDEVFKPIADWFGYVVFYPAPTEGIEWIGADIPIVVIVLVVGACFFHTLFRLYQYPHVSPGDPDRERQIRRYRRRSAVGNRIGL